MLRLVVGLGNPGLQYLRNRHNVGFMVLDELARRGAACFTNKYQSFYTEARFGAHKLLLQKPQTFMNLSGQAVLPLVQFYKLEPSQIVIVHDDLDLPFGRLRIRAGGSSGGQNGVKDITARLGTDGFVRLKIGISRPPAGWSVHNWVLSNFAAEEQAMLEQLLAVAADAVLCIAEFGVQEAQNRYNPTDLRLEPEAQVEQIAPESRTIEP
ncbi:MAG: aminoacyl-tRNA hydrolase [Deinococcales bacterium]